MSRKEKKEMNKEDAQYLQQLQQTAATQAAANPASAAQPRTLDLTPDYAGIVRSMLREVRSQARASRMFDNAHDAAQMLRAVQRWFWPLTVAINAATSVADVEEVRALMADMLKDINETATAIENEPDPDAAAEAYRRGFEDGRKGLL